MKAKYGVNIKIKRPAKIYECTVFVAALKLAVFGVPSE